MLSPPPNRTEQRAAPNAILPSPETQGETIEAICQNPPFLPFTASQAAAIAWVPLLKDIITAPPVSDPLGNVTLPKRSEVVKNFPDTRGGKIFATELERVMALLIKE